MEWTKKATSRCRNRIMDHRFRYVIVFAMAAIGVGSWLHWSGDGQRDTSPTALEREARGSAAAALRERPATLESIRAKDSKEIEGRAVPEQDTGEVSLPGQPSETTYQSTAHSPAAMSSQPATPEEKDLSIPEGRAFPVARSVEKECWIIKDSDFDCASVRWALKRIAEERSDPQWSLSTEGRIRAAIVSAPGVHIRALACRSTVCVVETDGELVTLATWTSLELDLLTVGNVRAFERTGNGESFRVQLWAFKRR